MKEQEIIPGTLVRYWSVMTPYGYKEGSTDTTVTSNPWQLPSGHLVCNVEGIRGCVAIDHLEKL